MRLVHRRGPPDDLSPEERTIATEIEIADSFLSRARGLMFRRSIPDDYALVFQFETPEDRDLHMVFVPFAIDAVWLVGTEVTAVKRLRPWIGLGHNVADTVIELPAGAADDIEPGDTVELVDE
ncbi:hypothetical protein halTADL_1155 [Halohasta litchfieldiae]|jgi:uncharacterized membrane protein (UPF0127 family)|uniref:DUF192 domain-containing protein n=1 Tax=Halohasta litchfieldiae TaxID=1073996 RepID=A0A1H6S4V5_9EURY|nr:DUF192 domain-containing protein [Halohasta litchfieldiae]ATW87948.1 hypothetical protein halTADL_1155 [Halohasta litchfieldiae]SEI61736.1 hypothetical protein SAMN05444271_10440 [Halohasta litchfieldiae]